MNQNSVKLAKPKGKDISVEVSMVNIPFSLSSPEYHVLLVADSYLTTIHIMLNWHNVFLASHSVSAMQTASIEVLHLATTSAEDENYGL
jgi:hypothetical protein